MALPNNQNTLFRFVSLRSPELFDKTNEENRFIKFTGSTDFHIKVESGSFDTKWEALQAAAEAFASQALDDAGLASASEAFYKASHWLAKFRKTAKATEIVSKANSVSLTGITLDTLWKNLFYQVVTQQSFYAKESIVQMIVLKNLKDRIQGLSASQAQAVVPILAQARVVLPVELFDERWNAADTAPGALLRGMEEQPVPHIEMLKAHETAKMHFEIGEIESIKLDIAIAFRRFYKARRMDYAKSKRENDEKNKSAVDRYYKEFTEKSRAFCLRDDAEKSDRDSYCNQPEIEFPELVSMDYTPRPLSDVKNFLQDTTQELLEGIVQWDIITGEDDVYRSIDEALRKKSDVILNNTPFRKTMLRVAGTTVAQTSTPPATASSSSYQYYYSVSVGTTGLVNLQLTLMLSNAYAVSSIVLRVKNGGQVVFTANPPLTYSTGLTLVFSNALAGFQVSPTATFYQELYCEVTFSNQVTMTFTKAPFTLRNSTNGYMVEKPKGPVGTNPGSGPSTDPEIANFIPKGFGLRQLGIADYKKVVSEICCYDAGEVAHIENVMAGEIREKVTTRSFERQTTTTESSETEKESLSDTVSAQRFEMQTEIAKIMQEQRDASAYAQVHTSWGNTTLDAGANYATNTSKEQSNTQAVTQAKELTQRAMERIVTKVKTEKTVRITESFVEENKHGFDNRTGEHVSGVYRFINAVYKNQVYNYGKRLMYEFLIPQPSKLHRLAMTEMKSAENALVLEKPVDPRTLGFPDFSYIQPYNYQGLAAKYQAEVPTCPEPAKYVNKTISSLKKGGEEQHSGEAEITLPEGYKTVTAGFRFAAKTDGDGSQVHSIGVALGNLNLVVFNKNTNLTAGNFDNDGDGDPDEVLSPSYSLDPFTRSLQFSYTVLNYHVINLTLSIKTVPLDETMNTWRRETFEAILKAYEAQMEQYNEKTAQVESRDKELLDSNPLFYREIEQLILRKNCISYLLDDTNDDSKRRFGRMMYNDNATFENHQVNVTREMDDYVSFAKFMEQAFEWNLMSYNFYPFYWGNREEWADLYRYESNDPTFRNFMQAGMARVVVTVKPGFEDALMHFMVTGQIWNGGQMPVLGDPLFLSIVDELREQEYTVEETWETVLPTNLVALQKGGVSVEQDGLPCGTDCKDDAGKELVQNLNKMARPV